MNEGLSAALGRLDVLLAAAIDLAEQAYGTTAASDPFRGLHIDLAEVERLLARPPGQPLLTVDADAHPRPGFTGTRMGSLQERFGLSGFDLDVVVIALAPELDLRYERLYAYLQDDATKRRPTVDLVLNLLCSTPEEKVRRRDRLTGDAPLLRNKVVRLIPDTGAEAHGTPLLAHTVALDAQIVTFLTGGAGPDSRLAEFTSLLDPTAFQNELAPELRQLTEALTEAAGKQVPLRVHLQGLPGSGHRQVAELAALGAGRPLLAADLTLTGQFPEDLARLLFQEAEFRDAVCFVGGVDTLLTAARTAELYGFVRHLTHSHATVVLAGAEPWPALQGVDGEPPAAVISALCPLPDAPRRRTLWRTELDRNGLELPDGELGLLADRFRLTPWQITEAATLAGQLPRRADATALEALFAVARARSAHQLGPLADKIEPVHRWGDIVLPPDALDQLRELCDRVARRELVLSDWGFGARLSLGRGVSALFAGPPGTGKTMAAEIVARELGIDLYRIDLSGIVSKWIGETEKNLDRIFRTAENANAALLFDEADALFGKRSEVRDAHDRYANIEVSYLLQKMETYEGLAILATNRIENLDEAFLRRLGFVVRFPFPDTLQRHRIWERVFPAGVPLAEELDHSAFAHRFMLSGAEIKNVALGAAYLAAARGSAVTSALVLHAVRREYEKAGRVFVGDLEGDAG
ncbi:AAA family ATPase [Streptomyces flaveus]|uniref:ATPase AAA n=1 Tax=Streptomyces flaveus TaxID=66370 RepID=A0A917RFD2_9ACTN|nr:AAA family ATPase [Streptomyces flaveus]GGL04322.1 ATPase AAA [Streptomyces flaveus]